MPVTSRLAPSYTSSSYNSSSRSSYRGGSVENGAPSYRNVGAERAYTALHNAKLASLNIPLATYGSSNRPPLPSASSSFRSRYDTSERSSMPPFDMSSIGKMTEARKYLMERRAADAAAGITRPRYSRTESRDVSTLNGGAERKSFRSSLSDRGSDSRGESAERVSDRILNFESLAGQTNGHGSPSTSRKFRSDYSTRPVRSSASATPSMSYSALLNGRTPTERLIPIRVEPEEEEERRPSVSSLRRHFDNGVSTLNRRVSLSDEDSSSTLSSGSQPSPPIRRPRDLPNETVGLASKADSTSSLRTGQKNVRIEIESSTPPSLSTKGMQVTAARERPYSKTSTNVSRQPAESVAADRLSSSTKSSFNIKDTSSVLESEAPSITIRLKERTVPIETGKPSAISVTNIKDSRRDDIGIKSSVSSAGSEIHKKGTRKSPTVSAVAESEPISITIRLNELSTPTEPENVSTESVTKTKDSKTDNVKKASSVSSVGGDTHKKGRLKSSGAISAVTASEPAAVTVKLKERITATETEISPAEKAKKVNNIKADDTGKTSSANSIIGDNQTKAHLKSPSFVSAVRARTTSGSKTTAEDLTTKTTVSPLRSKTDPAQATTVSKSAAESSTSATSVTSSYADSKPKATSLSRKLVPSTDSKLTSSCSRGIAEMQGKDAVLGVAHSSITNGDPGKVPGTSVGSGTTTESIDFNAKATKKDLLEKAPVVEKVQETSSATEFASPLTNGIKRTSSRSNEKVKTKEVKHVSKSETEASTPTKKSANICEEMDKKTSNELTTESNVNASIESEGSKMRKRPSEKKEIITNGQAECPASNHVTHVTVTSPDTTPLNGLTKECEPRPSPTAPAKSWTPPRLARAGSVSSSSEEEASSSEESEEEEDTEEKTAFGPEDGLTGLRNIGNTCFMNSVLQCLSNTRVLHDYMLRGGFTSDINTTTSSMKGALVQAFASLLGDLWSPGDGSVGDRALTTAPFKAQIQKFAPRFCGYQQQDAQEFLRYLLEGLHEDVNRVTSRPVPITTDIDDNLSDDQKAVESWKRFLRFDNSKFVDLFVGQLKSTLRCTVCGHASVTFDPFWDLSLPIPAKSGQVRLQACFELFSREEILDGDEMPTCGRCGQRRKCTKSFTIQKLPRILVVHLKRFSPTERYRGKLNTTVDFPLCALDLSPYSETSGDCRYNLYGVANHSGTLYSGHYTASCKHPYSSQWHEYNDGRVRPASQRNIVGSEAYVLFFEQTGLSDS